MRITGQNDALQDGNIAYTLQITTNSTDGAFNALNPTDLNFTNVDDDTVGITVSAGSNLLTSEGGNFSEFAVVLNSQPTNTVEICLTSTDTSEGIVDIANSDAVAVVGCGGDAQLTFTTGNWNVAQTVRITGQNDALQDGNIAYTLQITTNSTDGAYHALNPTDLNFTNVDNDTVGITVSLNTALVTGEDASFSEFDLVLNSQPTDTVEVCLDSTDTGEGIVDIGASDAVAVVSCATDAQLTFTTGNWNVAQTARITGQDDALLDGPIPYTIQITTVSNDGAYNAINPPDLSYVNLDDETTTKGVSIIAGTALLTTEGLNYTDFTVVLDASPANPVHICLESSDTSEGVIDTANSDALAGAGPHCGGGTQARLEFSNGNWSTPQSVRVVGVDDSVDDGNIAYTLDTTTWSNDAAYSAIDPIDLNFTNLDDDTAGITVNAGTLLSTQEQGGYVDFTVVLDSLPSDTVEICVESDDTTEGAVDTGNSDAIAGQGNCPVGTQAYLSFTTGNWNVPQTVRIAGVDDFVGDGDIAYTVLLDAWSNDGVYDAFDPPDLNFINFDD